MAWPPHALVVMQGTLPGPEIWTCGVRVQGSSGGFFPDPDGYLASIQAGLKTWFTTAANGLNALATLNVLKANNIDPAGHYADPVSHIYTYTTPGVGAGSNWTATFASIVYSWTTAASRGIACRGRIYPPIGLINPQGSPIITATDQTNARTAAKALLTVIANGAGGTELACQPSVVSPGTPRNGHVGVARLITGVRIGSVLDVQRRRKEQIPESYVGAAWP